MKGPTIDDVLAAQDAIDRAWPEHSNNLPPGVLWRVAEMRQEKRAAADEELYGLLAQYPSPERWEEGF